MTADNQPSGSKRFGVVLFDDVKDPGPGWACIHGDEKAWRIQGPDDLSTGTIWWSNIGYEDFFRRTEMWRRSWIRHDKYLVVSHTDVLREWGHDPKDNVALTPNFICWFVALVFHRIMCTAFMLIRQVDYRARMDQFFVGQTLRADMRRILPEPEYPKGDAAAVMKSGNAFDEITVTGMRPMRDGRRVVLRRPRMYYAMEMLQTPIPQGPFEFMSRAALRAKSQDRVAWIRDLGEPCMTEISVERMNQDIAPVYGFGNSMDRNKRSHRSWVSHPEFLMLERLAEIDVKSAYVGRQYSSLMDDLPEPIKEFLTDKFFEYSWTAGVIAETIWRALALSEDRTKAGKVREGEDRADTSWQGAWIKAADKVSMFLVSLDLAKRGYTVVSYGLGWTTLSVQEEMIKDLVNDALSLGLVPNMVDVPEDMFSKGRTVQWGGDKRSEMLSHLQMTHQSNMLWNLDKIPIIKPTERRQYLMTLREKHSKGRI